MLAGRHHIQPDRQVFGGQIGDIDLRSHPTGRILLVGGRGCPELQIRGQEPIGGVLGAVRQHRCLVTRPITAGERHRRGVRAQYIELALGKTQAQRGQRKPALIELRDPRDLGIPLADIDDLLGGDPSHNAGVIRRVLGGERGPVRDIVLLNAAAGIVAYRLFLDASAVQRPIVERLSEGMVDAAAAIDSGAGAAKLEAWITATRRLAG